MPEDKNFVSPITGLPTSEETLKADLSNPYLLSSGTYTNNIKPTDFSNLSSYSSQDPNAIDKRYEAQSWGDVAGNGLVRFGLTTGTKFMNMLGYVGSLPLAIADGELAFNNAYLRAFDSLEESIKESFPVYHESTMDQKN